MQKHKKPTETMSVRTFTGLILVLSYLVTVLAATVLSLLLAEGEFKVYADRFHFFSSILFLVASAVAIPPASVFIFSKIILKRSALISGIAAASLLVAAGLLVYTLTMNTYLREEKERSDRNLMIDLEEVSDPII